MYVSVIEWYLTWKKDVRTNHLIGRSKDLHQMLIKNKHFDKLVRPILLITISEENFLKKMDRYGLMSMAYKPLDGQRFCYLK